MTWFAKRFLKRWNAVAALPMAAGLSCALGQTHKVAKPEAVVRALGVYEWTGDLKKPTASRLIPISLAIEGRMEDAGIYLARPIPFALTPGNEYELQKAGVAAGIVELSYARHLQTADMAYDDGWFGYGMFKPEAPPKKEPALRASRTTGVITSSGGSGKPRLSDKTGSDAGSGDSSKKDSGATSAGDPDRPTMKRKTGSDTSDNKTPDTGTAQTTPADDPDRPTMKRKSDPDTSSTKTADSGAAGTPADDPDRPTMKRKAGSDSADDKTDKTADSGTAQTTPADDPDRPTMKRKPDPDTGSTKTADSDAGAGAPADDPDRPTLKRRTAAERKSDQKEKDLSSVSGVGSLNNDPDRPNLHRGKPAAAMSEEDLPKLSGLPKDLHQMAAISDAANRPVHDFSRPWEDEKEHVAILAKMEEMARLQLAKYGADSTRNAAPATPPSVKTAPTTARSRTTAAARSKRAAAAKAPQTPLLEEDLRGYTLSYGGAPTYAFTAETGGTGADLRYVTIVAQDDSMNGLRPAIQSVTDAAHLDRTPRMRLVDVADADASNRASLVFELRGQNSRQFALYRVIGSKADQMFATGSAQ